MSASSEAGQGFARGPEGLRRVLGSLLLVLAAGLLAAASLGTYGLTSEYGYSPNDDPLRDLSRAAAGHALVALLVTALGAGGLALTGRLPRRSRLLRCSTIFVVACTVLGLSTALGQRALDARCAGPERASTAAC